MRKWIGCVGALLAALTVFAKYGATISLNRADGLYKIGETVTCRVKLTKNGEPLVGQRARMTLKWEGKTLKSEDFETTGKVVKFNYTADKPGWVFFGFELLGKNGKVMRGDQVQRHSAKPTIVTEIGAIIEPDKVVTGITRPADFEEFWAKRRAELDKIPIEPKLEPMESPDSGIKLFKVTVPAIGEHPVTGYLALPADAKPGSCPAYVDWASWSASDANPNSAIGSARQGFIGFAPTWHGRPVAMGKKWYNYKTTITGIDGGMVGIQDRDTWCFGFMYYRVMRALDFVKSLPEWDHKTLVSRGGSLGGAQSAAAAALDKDVTLALIMNPCFCEFDGDASGRTGSIPRGGARAAAKSPAALKAQSYYDCVNFAPMIKCRTFVCTGGTDELCPPSNVYAVYNALPAGTPKQIFFNPAVGHYGQINKSVAPHIKALFDSVKITNYDVKSERGGSLTAK
jgi:cephalosporin-C deacetylase-like acetyl esterase